MISGAFYSGVPYTSICVRAGNGLGSSALIRSPSVSHSTDLFLIEMKIISQISHIKEYHSTSCFGSIKKKYITPPNALTDDDKSFF